MTSLGEIARPSDCSLTHTLLAYWRKLLVTALSYALALVATASLVLRFRLARGMEPQQIKWFAYAGAVTAVGAILTYVGGWGVTDMAWLRWGPP